MIPGKRSVWQRVWLGAAVCAVGVVGLCAWPYTVDDAYIVGRYADRLARGLGYTFNPGPPSDGVTGPAWLLPGFLAARLGGDPILAAKIGGLACTLAATALALSRVRRRAQGGALLATAAALIAVQPTLGCSGVSGLEAGAAALVVAIASGGALGPLRPSTGLFRGSCLGLCVGLLAWLRPELLALGAVLLGAFALRADRRATWLAFSLAGAGVGSIVAFRAALTGHVLPLAVAAKLGTLEDGASYVIRALAILSGGFGLVLVTAGVYFGRTRDDRWLGAALLAHTAAIALAGGDWMPGFRLFAPVLPLYAVLAAVGFVRLARPGHAQRALRRAGAWACLIFACALPALDLATRIPQLWAAGASRDRVGAQIAESLRQRAKRVALVDVGYLGYRSGCEVIDLAGITDREIASLPGGHLNKRISAEYLAMRRPDALLLHSSSPPMAAEGGRLIGLRGYPVEQRLAQSAWVQREFQLMERFHYAPAYYYALLLRRAPAHASAGTTDGLRTRSAP